MKYAIIIPDGCADLPIDALGGLTPMQAAKTPNLDALAKIGRVGQTCYVPKGMPPGSDVATLGLLGYDPRLYYTGRAPLEAVAQGMTLTADDWAIRCNFVTVQNETMVSFSAGHISSEESVELIETLNRELVPTLSTPCTFYASVSYRNLAVVRQGDLFDSTTKTAPPHDYADKPVHPAKPTGKGNEFLYEIYVKSGEFLRDHPINQSRVNGEKLPATHIWPWGQGQVPQLPKFADQFREHAGQLRGGMITAVDLLRGIAKLIGWETIDVPGATGYIDTDYAAKGRYAADALTRLDVVCVHVEAPDEAGHIGSYEKKILTLEEIDAKVIPPVLHALQKFDEWRLFVSPDHPTPVATKTHNAAPVPWLMAGDDISASGATTYCERTGAVSRFSTTDGWSLIRRFIVPE